MNEQPKFTRKSFLQRFVISQVLLIAVLLVIIGVSGQRSVRPVKMDRGQMAAKLISVKMPDASRTK